MNEARERRASVVEYVILRGMDEEDERDPETREQAKRRERAERRTELECGMVRPMYAIATRTYRQYGGPEEGGWYYDHETVLEVRRAWDYRGLLVHVRELMAENPTDRYGRSSVLGNSGDVTIYLTRHVAAAERLESKERPRYE